MLVEETSLRIKPQQKRAVEKVDRILKATALLLERSGVEELNILAIAREADLPPATIYHYFENRTAIFMALAERTMHEVDMAFAAALSAAAGSGDPDWLALLRQLYEAYKAAPGYRHVLPLLRYSAGLREIVSVSNRRSVEFLMAALRHIPVPAARLQRVALMIAEAVQCFLDLALCASDDAEAEAYVSEMQVIVGAIALHYQAMTSSLSR